MLRPCSLKLSAIPHSPSLLRFMSRAIIQYIYFTPQPANFPMSPFRGPHLGLITLVNFGCLLVHIFATAPEAGEAVRGYIHGGLFVDFVGEKGPISKVKLVFFDTLIVVLQAVLLAVDVERTGLKKAMNKSSANSSDQSISTSPVQDLDSEERGLHRDIGMNVEDIELRPLRSSIRQTNHFGDAEEAGGFETPTAFQQRRTDEHPENIYDGGQEVIANLHIIESIRTAWRGRYGEYAFAPSQAWSLSRMQGGMRIRHSVDQAPRGGSDTA